MQAFGLSEENFRLNIWYNDPATGVDLNYIPRNPLDGTLLIQLLGMDRLDINGMTQPDGVFDFVDNAATMGGTIHSQNGRIFSRRLSHLVRTWPGRLRNASKIQTSLPT